MRRTRLGPVMALMLVLVATPLSAAAWAGRSYRECADAPDGLACMAEVASQGSRGDGREDIVPGILVPAGRSDLIATFTAENDAATDQSGPAMAEGDAVRAFALLAAAYRVREPYGDPEVARVLAGRDIDAISSYAGLLWSSQEGLWNERISPPGMAVIWSRIAETVDADPAGLARVAEKAAESGQRQAALRLLARAEEKNPDDEARMAIAWVYAAYLGMAAEAQQQMELGGSRASGQEVNAASEVKLAVAFARLKSGYSPEAARDAMAEQMRAIGGIFYLTPLRLALTKAGARNELLTYADQMLEAARDRSGGNHFEYFFYGEAAEAYLAAGERAKALATAREGLPFVAKAVMENAFSMREEPPADASLRQRLSAKGKGVGSNVLRVLYRAGAQDEALAPGWLSGFDRYLIARETGEPANPAWVVSDGLDTSVHAAFLLLAGQGDRSSAKAFYQSLAAVGPAVLMSEDEFEMSELQAAFPEAESLPNAPRTEQDNSFEHQRYLGLFAALSGDRQQSELHFRRCLELIATDDFHEDASRLAHSWAWARAALNAG